MDVYPLLYLKWITNTVLRGTLLSVLWQPGQERFEEEWIHTYVGLSPFTAHPKLSQHG